MDPSNFYYIPTIKIGELRSLGTRCLRPFVADSPARFLTKYLLLGENSKVSLHPRRCSGKNEKLEEPVAKSSGTSTESTENSLRQGALHHNSACFSTKCKYVAEVSFESARWLASYFHSKGLRLGGLLNAMPAELLPVRLGLKSKPGAKYGKTGDFRVP